MSYLIYINNLQIETYSQSFALTRQNNDIADISNRNADFSQNIKIPRTANNTIILETAGLIGRNSNVPYKKNTAQIIDADTGVHLVINGWAVLLNTDSKDYNLSIYSGNINFFKAIENLTLTECGLTELNHIKNLANVKATWTNTTLPYRYLIADYNGKMYHSNKLNIDYQVPSASVNYLWNRIFDFINFEFEGAIFNNEEFVDLWLSYPKPVPTTEPVYELVTNQNSIFIEQPFYDGNALINRFGVLVLPTPITGTFINSIPSGIGQRILTAGTFQIVLSGSVFSPYTNLTYNNLIFILRDNLGNIVQTSQIVTGQSLTFTAGVDFTFSLGSDAYSQIFALTGGFVTSINRVTGYTLGFDQAFIDFKVSDFIKEIMMRFALTPFAIPNTNKVKFLTLDEIFQDTNVQDWTDNFHGVTNESYILSRYAQRNDFKFKYNDSNQKHNDGYIPVANENIKENATLFSSRIFSVEPKLSNEYSGSNIYPIWSKNVKDNNTIEYKELDNRFYFLRSQLKNELIEIGSEFLGSHIHSDFYYKESYYRCKWQELINVWYKNINKLLDFTKVITANIELKSFEFSQIQMEKIVFIEQLGSYFLINKISNFTPQKVTKVELVKVEYFSEPIEILPTDPFVEIVSYVISSCNITFTLNHNLQNGQILYLKLFRSLGVIGIQEVQTFAPVQGVISGNTIVLSLNNFEIANLSISVIAQLNGFTSIFTPIQTNNIDITSGYPLNCYVPTAEPTTLTLVSAIYEGLNSNNSKKYKLVYDFSLITNNQYVVTTQVFASVPFTLWAGTTAERTFNGWTDLKDFQMSQNLFGAVVPKEINEVLQYNFLTLPNTITKIRIKINNTISNEINI